jgi:hypothetical protein
MHDVETNDYENRWITSYDGKLLIYETKEQAQEVLNNLKQVKVKKNGKMKLFKYELHAISEKDYKVFKEEGYPLYKNAIKDKDKNILEGIIC